MAYTIEDVSNHAHVSPVTVSRYFHNPEKVAHRTAKRIQAAIDALGYEPLKRRSPSRKTAPAQNRDCLAVVLAIPSESLTDTILMPVIPAVIGGVIDEAQRANRLVTFLHLNERETLNRLLSPGFCDGVILFGSSVLESLDRVSVGILQQCVRHKPFIRCLSPSVVGLLDCGCINYDNDAVGPMAADYLYARGHSTVAVFNNDPTNATISARASGFRGRALALGLECHVVEGPHASLSHFPTPALFTSMAERCEALALPNRFGAFFCSDEVLRGFCMAWLMKGNALSAFDMIGCDKDERIMNMFVPQPASINLHFEEIGREAVRHVIKQINGQPEASRYSVLIPPALWTGPSLVSIDEGIARRPPCRQAGEFHEIANL